MAKTTFKDYLALGIGAATGIPPSLLSDRWQLGGTGKKSPTASNGDWAGEAGPPQNQSGGSSVAPSAAPDVDLSQLPPTLKPWMDLLGIPNLSVQSQKKKDDDSGDGYDYLTYSLANMAGVGRKS